MNIFTYTGTGSASGTSVYGESATLTVNPSTTYILSGWIDASFVTAGSPKWSVYKTDLSVSYLDVTQTAGSNGRVQGSFTTGAGVTQVVVLCHTNNCTVTSAKLLKFWAPQLEQNTASGLATAYKPNAFDDTQGTIARNAHHSSFTTAIDSSSRLVTSMHDSGSGNDFTPAHLNTVIDISSGAKLKVAQALSGSILPYANHHAALTSTFASSPTGGLYMNANQIAWKHFLGDTSGDTSTSMVDTGNKRFLHNAMSSGVQTAIDSSGNLLSISWSGIKTGSGGAMSGFTNTGTSSSNSVQLATNQVITFQGQLKLAATTADFRVLLGNNTNGYGLRWATSGAVTLIKIVSGTVSNIGSSIGTVTQDTSVHSFKVTLIVGASNTVEGSFDALAPQITTDNGLSLNATAQPFTILDGNNGTTLIYGFMAETSMPHYHQLHNTVKTAVDTSGRVIGSVYDGTTTLSPANFTNAITNAGKVKVAQADSGSILPRANHHSDFTNTVNTGGGIDFTYANHTNKNLDNIADGSTYGRPKGTELSSGIVTRLGDGGGTNFRTYAHISGAIDTSSRIVGHVYDGTTELTPANFTNAINTSGKVKVDQAVNNLPQANHDATVLLGSVTGVQKNHVPDSDIKFSQSYWTLSGVAIAVAG